ncbi:GntR family transcriptional regulator [Streptomyces sp. NPDC090112]|uniref:GntR family transcriptional regulator n=1 Tax=Streptomyces sp. NPDC090112 TaxID=3365949 RepID=UPI0037F23C28
MAVLKYEEIAESLRAQIANGEFPPGTAIPSGRDLAEQWSVSRATAIKAVDVLRADGIVEARQGTGFIVVETPVGRPAGARHAGAARVSGGMPFQRIGNPEWTVPPAHIAGALGMDEGEEALLRARLMHYPDGTPHSYVTAWFPPSIARNAPRLAQAAPIAEGTTRYIRRQTGRFPVEGSDTTTVRLASEAEAERLRLERPTAVAVVLHVATDHEGGSLVCEEGVTPEGIYERTESYPM